MSDLEPQSEQQSPEQSAPLDSTDTPPVSSVRRHRGLFIGGAAVVALGIAVGGAGLGTALATLHSASSTTRQATGPNSPQHSVTGPGTASVNATSATSAQKVGVVTIVSILGYNSRSEAAGTGIILNSTGEILTNNHVVEGSTAIRVTVESAGTSYTAKVVGTDGTDDIAVLQLVDSSGADVTGLAHATIDRGTLTSGDAVISVGNAEGTGNLVAASGTVTALKQSIAVANDITGADEHLTGLIETNADVVSGDSGGPLIDARGQVTGVVTAASSGSRYVTGYAIPIDTALSIAKKIVSGEASSNIVIGLPAFLGVELATAQNGAGVLLSGIVDGSAASGTGLAAGDTVTAVDFTAVTTTDSLSALIKAHAVGDRVTITYADASGTPQQVTVTLVQGPAA